MKVFLVGEGRHDIGDLAAESPYRNGKPGFMQPVITRLIGADVSFDGQKIALLGKARVSRSKDALAKKAFIAGLLAVNAGSDLLVFIADLDRGSGTGTRSARADIERRSAAIKGGADEAAAADGLDCVPGIPCRTVEAWAIADLAAVAALTDSSAPVRLPKGKGPEELWGKPRDSDSNHPKMVLERMLGRPATQDDLSRIAASADLILMRSECSLSFDPFAAKLEAAAA